MDYEALMAAEIYQNTVGGPLTIPLLEDVSKKLCHTRNASKMIVTTERLREKILARIAVENFGGYVDRDEAGELMFRPSVKIAGRWWLLFGTPFCPEGELWIVDREHIRWGDAYLANLV